MTELLVERLGRWVPFGFALSAITMFLANLLFGSGLFASGFVGGVVAISALIREVHSHKKDDRGRNIERTISSALIVTVASVFVWKLSLSLVPRTTWTDFSAHGGLTTWIASHGRLPNSSLWPVGLANYPNAAHVGAALLSKFLPLLPLEALWVMALLAVFGQFPLIHYITRVLTIGTTEGSVRALWAGMGSLVFFFLAYQHSAGLVTLDFYFAQAVGQWFALAGVAFVVRGVHRNRRLCEWVPPATVLVAGSLLAYPQGAVVVVGASAMAFVAARMSNKLRFALIGSAAIAFLVAVAVLSRTVWWNRVAFAGLPSNAPQISIRTMGGFGTVALSGLGLGQLAWVHKRWFLPILGAIGSPLLVTVSMLLMRRGVPIRINFTNYRVLKNLFGLVPYGVITAGVALHSCVSWLMTGFPRRRLFLERVAPFVATAAVLIVIIRIHRPQNSLRPNYSRDAYRIGLSLPESISRNNLGLAGPGFGVYTLRWAGIGPIFEPNLPEDIPRSIRWETWPDKSLKEDYLLVSGPWKNRFLHRPGVAIFRQRGDALVFVRTSRNGKKLDG